jgi:ribonuclease HI
MTFHSEGSFVECVRVYLDGACPRRIGSASVGVILFDQVYRELEKVGVVIGLATCNKAEYEALILGLDLAAKYTRRRVECYMDSDVVHGQMEGRYRLRDDELRRLFHSAKDRERPFTQVIYTKVDRTDQRLSIAHRLAHDALNGRGLFPHQTRFDAKESALLT